MLKKYNCKYNIKPEWVTQSHQQFDVALSFSLTVCSPNILQHGAALTGP